jgi:hypothetical protein
MAKKQTLKASTSAVKSEPPSHHFYASSVAEWRVSVQCVSCWWPC